MFNRSFLGSFQLFVLMGVTIGLCSTRRGSVHGMCMPSSWKWQTTDPNHTIQRQWCKEYFIILQVVTLPCACSAFIVNFCNTHVFYYNWTRLCWLLISFFIIFISWRFGRSVLISQIYSSEEWALDVFSLQKCPLYCFTMVEDITSLIPIVCVTLQKKNKRKKTTRMLFVGFQYLIFYINSDLIFFQINTVCVF